MLDCYTKLDGNNLYIHHIGRVGSMIVIKSKKVIETWTIFDKALYVPSISRSIR